MSSVFVPFSNWPPPRSNRGWGYIKDDTFKSSQFLIDQLIDIVSKNGNLLRNFAARLDGTIPEEVNDRLLAMGAWLKVNGDAIYTTTTWKTFGEGPTKVEGGAFHDTDTRPYTPEDFRFTAKDSDVYAIGMTCPTGGKALIHAFGTAQEGMSFQVVSVELLGSPDKIAFKQPADALEVTLPADMQCKYAYVLKLTPGTK